MAANAALQKCVVLITGATGAIGQAIARQIAARAGYEVWLLARNEDKAACAARDIVAASGNRDVSVALLDLSCRSAIEAFAADWKRPVHVLINNAAIAPHRREETADGIEMQFAVNVLSYYWLTRALQARLFAGAPARVVNVASYWAGDLDLADPEFRVRRYDQHRAYRQAKQANRMLTRALAERFEARGVTVNACHPGDVDSVLSRALGFGGHESADQAARTPVWLAIDAACAGLTGLYFEHGRQVRCRFAEQTSEVARLLAVCQGYSS